MVTVQPVRSFRKPLVLDICKDCMPHTTTMKTPERPKTAVTQKKWTSEMPASIFANHGSSSIMKNRSDVHLSSDLWKVIRLKAWFSWKKIVSLSFFLVWNYFVWFENGLSRICRLGKNVSGCCIRRNYVSQSDCRCCHLCICLESISQKPCPVLADYVFWWAYIEVGSHKLAYLVTLNVLTKMCQLTVRTFSTFLVEDLA